MSRLLMNMLNHSATYGYVRPCFEDILEVLQIRPGRAWPAFPTLGGESGGTSAALIGGAQ